MWAKLKFLFFYFLSWLAFFEVMRLLFIAYHFEKASTIPAASWLASLWYGLRMDLSAAAYIIVPVCLFVLLSLFVRFFQRLTVYKVYTFVVLLLVCLISLSDLEIYGAWGFRIDAGPLRFLSTPREAMASVAHLPWLWITLAFVAGYLLFWFCFRWLLRYIFFQQQNRHYLATAVVLLLATASLILPIRGGFQLAPMNQSTVYFSQYNFANHAAINATWNFLHSLTGKSNVRKNPYRYLPAAEAKQIADSLFRAEGKSSSWLGVDYADSINIILVIWESFTAKAVDLKWKGKEVTPHFNSLKTQGLYFNNCFASGDRTNKGIPAVLSAYPAMPNTTIIHNPAKSAKLPTISGELNARGYHSRFYYGGEPEFANIKSYLVHAGFNPIIGKNDFSEKDMNSKWGAHDGVVMERIVNDFSQLPQPFFLTWLTLSSHEPFETPVPVQLDGKDWASKFLNSIHYSDQIFGAFVDSCRKQPWWDRTVLIVIGDHGHPQPETGFKGDDFRTPMLWLGGALKPDIPAYSSAVSQLDLAATLLAQLGQPIQSFPFSRNLADSTVQHNAFFSFNDGFGWASDSGIVVYDNVGKRPIAKQGDPGRNAIRAGQAMQQFSFQDFMDK